MNWAKYGILAKGTNEPPPVAGTMEGTGKVLVILGGATGIWKDWSGLKEVHPIIENAHLMAINDIGMYVRESVAHWTTLHGEHMRYWLGLRAGHYLNKPMLHFLTSGQAKRFDNAVGWNFKQGIGGTSGLLGLLVGVLLGYDKIVLCGIPLDDSGHFHSPYKTPAWVRRKAWKRDRRNSCWEYYIDTTNNFGDRVRSMSGHTRLMLGSPTKEWLNNGTQST